MMIENLVMLWHNNKTHIVDLFIYSKQVKKTSENAHMLSVYFLLITHEADW